MLGNLNRNSLNLNERVVYHLHWDKFLRIFHTSNTTFLNSMFCIFCINFLLNFDLILEEEGIQLLFAIVARFESNFHSGMPSIQKRFDCPIAFLHLASFGFFVCKGENRFLLKDFRRFLLVF